MNAKRRLPSIAIILALLSGLLASSAQTVTGYVHKVFAGGSRYTLIANPFNTTNNTFAGLFGHAPPGTQFLKWDTTNQDFATFIKTPVGSGWSPPAGAVATLNPGEAAFVLIRGADLTNTFAGEVLQGNLTNKLVPGFNLVGNIIPDSVTISPPSAGSRIDKWDVALQDYKTPSGEFWPPRVTIAAGEGFFVRTSVPIEWVRNFSTP
jgi:hypothetical protein